MYIVYIYIYLCCFSPLVARPHLESTTVIEIQQVYIESCEMILSWLNIIIYQYDNMASDRTNLVMKPYSRNWRYLSGLLPQQKQAVLLSEGKAQTSQTTDFHLCKKSCHLKCPGPCHLAVGFGPWKALFFTEKKNENTIEYQKNQLKHRYGLLKQPIFTSSSPSQQLHNLPSCLCKNFVLKNPA